MERIHWSQIRKCRDMVIEEADSSSALNHLTIEAEDFDTGGEGVAYHDWESTNYGAEKDYREPGGVDLDDSLILERFRISETGGWDDYQVFESSHSFLMDSGKHKLLIE